MRQTLTGLFIGLQCSVPQIANQPIAWRRQNERGKEENTAALNEVVGATNRKRLVGVRGQRSDNIRLFFYLLPFIQKSVVFVSDCFVFTQSIK